MNTPTQFSRTLSHERKQHTWTQEELARKVGVDVKTVKRWERGVSVPRPYARHVLSKVLGKSIEELGLADSEDTDIHIPLQDSGEQAAETEVFQVAEHLQDESFQYNKNILEVAFHEDRGEAPNVGRVYGREAERDRISSWLREDACRVVSIVGIGGVGKSTLAALVATHLRDIYPYRFWRSLQDAPPLKQVLKDCIHYLSHQRQSDLPDTEDELLVLLLHYLRHRKCLLVFDNFESILQPQQRAGLYQKGYEGYGVLIHRLAEAHHSSCLLLTSRDKPGEIAELEGSRSPVRSLALHGIEVSHGQAMLQEKELVGADEEWSQLIQLYAGNPLALKLIAGPIHEVFGGSLARFLADGTYAFGDVSNVLDQQFIRLMPQEQDILIWLALEREPRSLDALSDDLLQQVPRSELIETISSLRRRSLIEPRTSASFTLQPVIMDYVIARLIKRFVDEFQGETGESWNRYALLNAGSKEYVRESQMRVLLAPVAQRLLDIYGREHLKLRFQERLAAQRHLLQQSYEASNILHILIFLKYDLHDFDFSYLIMRRPYLQNVRLPDVNFTSAQFVAPVFANTFGNILSVAFSPDNTLLAAGTATGNIWLYDTVQERQCGLFSGHTDGVWAVAFSPDQRLLASSSDDETIRLWNVETGTCISILHNHHQRVRTLTFTSEGTMLVSGSDDGTIHLLALNEQNNHVYRMLEGHTDRVWAVALHKDGHILATGSTDHTVRLWNMETCECIAILEGHTGSIRSLSFHPTSNLLASGSDDATIRLWDVTRAEAIGVLPGHTNRVWSVAFSHDGRWLASGSEDTMIRIWETHTGRCMQILQGHTHGVRSVAFSHNSMLASGSDDQTVRLWDIRAGHCTRTFQGYTHRIWSVLFSPDGLHLLSCSEDQTIRLWDFQSSTRLRTIEERHHAARCIACSPDGASCASGGEDETVRLWELATGRELKVLRGHTDWIRAVAFHPDGYVVASGSEDTTVRLWDVSSGFCLHTIKGHTSWIRDLAFTADGRILASCGDDATIRLWDAVNGSALTMLSGHAGRVRSIAFHPERPLLVSGGEDYTIRLWDIVDGQCLSVIKGHAGRIHCVAFSPDGRTFVSSGEDNAICLWNTDDEQNGLTLHTHTRVRRVSFHPGGELLASSGDDGSIQLWHLPSGRLLKTLVSERPYEGMNITNVQGLTPAQKETLRLLGAFEDM